MPLLCEHGESEWEDVRILWRLTPMGESSIPVNLQGKSHGKALHMLNVMHEKASSCLFLEGSFTLSLLKDLAQIHFDPLNGLPLGFVYRKSPRENKRHLKFWKTMS